MKKSAAPRRILIIEDDPLERDILVAVLASEGRAVTGAADGREGIETAKRERPDLVVTDLMLPGATGFEVISALRADARTAATPIILLTAMDLSLKERARLEGQGVRLEGKGEVSGERFREAVRETLGEEAR